MPFSRRRFLRVSLGTGLWASLGVGCAGGKDTTPSSAAKSDHWQTLTAYLDTLIPADESPSATQLGVTAHLISRTEADSGYRQLLTNGCDALDAQARQYGVAHFAALSEPQREEVISLAAAGKAGLWAHMFFDRTQADAFSYYYAQPQSWHALEYAGPPQPRGFMDYAQPPTRRSSAP
ncbi:MAG: gluconate 2-dehydrogenase subunit 3 family protein [Candidatus Binatia bacterium]